MTTLAFNIGFLFFLVLGLHRLILILIPLLSSSLAQTRGKGNISILGSFYSITTSLVYTKEERNKCIIEVP